MLMAAIGDIGVARAGGDGGLTVHDNDREDWKNSCKDRKDSKKRMSHRFPFLVLFEEKSHRDQPVDPAYLR